MAADSPSSPPDRNACVALSEITRDTVRPYCRLKVAPAQEGVVAPNAVSIAQAYFHPEAWFRGIAADGAPVGFAMLEDWTAMRDDAPEEWRSDPYVGRPVLQAPRLRGNGKGGRRRARIAALALE